jgi:RNA polymerase sigma-70 factor (ECF subfamily)
MRAHLLSNPEPLIRQVYAYVAYRIGDGPDAEDVTADVFERALRYAKSYDAEKGEPISWLLGIARFRIVELAGSRQAEPVSEDPSDASLPNPEARIVAQLDLREALASLDDRDRELIAMRYGADLKARQIAEVLGMRTNTVEVALHRALGRLRSALEGNAQASWEGRRQGEAGRERRVPPRS